MMLRSEEERYLTDGSAFHVLSCVPTYISLHACSLPVFTHAAHGWPLTWLGHLRKQPLRVERLSNQDSSS